jgi:hypothetical protein
MLRLSEHLLGRKLNSGKCLKHERLTATKALHLLVSTGIRLSVHLYNLSVEIYNPYLGDAVLRIEWDFDSAIKLKGGVGDCN